MTPLRLAPDHARRFVRRALLLDAPVPDVATALAHHGFIQIDPVNVCGRAADLIFSGALAGWLGFTMPSVVLMAAFA